LGLEKRKKSVLGIIGIIVIAVGLGSFLFFDESVVIQPIKIGVTLAETGPASGIDIELRDGMQIAVDEINSHGGLNGRPIELIIVDNESNPEKAKKDFLEIEETHAPLMYISSTSTISTAVSPLAEENEVVLMISATAREITVGKQWTYRYFAMADVEAVPILQILDELDIKNLGILYLNDEYGRDVSNEVATRFENSEGIVSKESFEPNAIDFKENIAKLQNEDAIYVVAFPDYVKIIFKQLREANYSGEILAPSDAVTFKIINMPEANRVYLAAPKIYDTKFLFASTVSENFESRYNKQFDHFAANGYDIVRLLGGLLQNEELSRDNVKRILDEGFTYSGVFGSVDVLPGEHDISFPLFPSQVVEHDISFPLFPSQVVDGKLVFRR
jgi:branched-chain amino acid transport system substrate-binding protein